jgi:hypothetical protein
MNDAAAKSANGQSAGARPAVLSLSIKEKAALYAAYMPYLKNGGIFVPISNKPGFRGQPKKRKHVAARY